MIIGIALGVAVVVAIDLANANASRAFDLSSEAVTGQTTHQIVGGPDGLDDSIYTQLRRSGLVDVGAPVITDFVSSAKLGNRPFQLLGIDPFAEAPFHNYLSSDNGVSIEQLTRFLTQPGAILIPTNLANQFGLAPGETLNLEISGHEKNVFVAGLLQPANTLSQRALDSVILADISTAQELTGRLGKLDRIDLILPEVFSIDDPRALTRLDGIKNLLPPSARLLLVEARRSSLRYAASSSTSLWIGKQSSKNHKCYCPRRVHVFFYVVRCCCGCLGWI